MTHDLDTDGDADVRALLAHERLTTQKERAYAADAIAAGGVARFWHPRTGLRVVATLDALDAFFAETKQRL